MKIITTTLEDFVNNEIAEHGHDYVEAQFLLGYEPLRQNGVWIWGKNVTSQLLRSIDVNSNVVSSSVSVRNRAGVDIYGDLISAKDG